MLKQNEKFECTHPHQNDIKSILDRFLESAERISNRTRKTIIGSLLVLTTLLGVITFSNPRQEEGNLVPSNATYSVIPPDILSAGLTNQSNETTVSLPEEPPDVEETATPNPTPEPHPNNTVLTKDVTAPVIAEIQLRLMELGYMEQDEPTEYFGPVTKDAVKLFQQKNGLTLDGAIGDQTYNLLMSNEAKKYVVSVGDEGMNVGELQLRLQELGYIDKATEYFGTETESAIKKFQERNGLSVDGAVGENTREMLYSENVKPNFFERGETSKKVREYQLRLIELGYLVSESDGKYGVDTEAAVRRFQERNALIADGYLGPQSIRILLSSEVQANALMIGMKGDDIEKVQARLKTLGYIKDADGYFGSKTEDGIRKFQKRNSLNVDGKVGKLTMAALTSSKAKKASSGSNNSKGADNPTGSGSPPQPVELPEGASVDRFIAIAMNQLGSKYVLGAKGPERFDCSGYVYWCLNQAGVKQGYMTSKVWQTTTKYQRITNMKDLLRGDIISFKGHVGIYLGDGKMIDASSSQGKVRIANSIQSSKYWTKNFVAGFRVF